MRKLPKIPMPPELREPCGALALAVAATSVDGAKLHQGYVVDEGDRATDAVAVIVIDITVRRTSRTAYLEERRRARPRKGDASPLAAGEGGK